MYILFSYSQTPPIFTDALSNKESNGGFYRTKPLKTRVYSEGPSFKSVDRNAQRRRSAYFLVAFHSNTPLSLLVCLSRTNNIYNIMRTSAHIWICALHTNGKKGRTEENQKHCMSEVSFSGIVSRIKKY